MYQAPPSLELFTIGFWVLWVGLSDVVACRDAIDDLHLSSITKLLSVSSRGFVIYAYWSVKVYKNYC